MGKEGGAETDEARMKGKEEIHCGLGQCRPPFLQRCANINCITAALAFAGLATSTLSVYINSQITTLERQFGFSSSVSGILLSCNDFGYLLTTLFMSYLTRRIHILRGVSVSTLLFGISGLICTVPFFASLPNLPSASDLLAGSGSRNFSDDVFSSDGGSSGGNVSEMIGGMMIMMKKGRGAFEKYLCSESEVGFLSGGANDTSDGGCGSEVKHGDSAVSEDKKWMAVCFIGLGLIFQGFGKSPRQPFVSTYIDDNVPKTKTTLYLGIISSCAIFGPVLAFTLGGLFSRMYLTLEDTTMSPRDPRWVGAWWLGFLVFGSLGILTSIPTLFLPRRLRPQPHLRRLEMERKRAAKGRRYCHELKEFLKSVARLAQTPVYVCIVLGSCSILFGTSGVLAFLPKYLETQFMIPAWKANIILGVLNILSAAGGTLVGGIVTSRLKMQPRACLKMMIGCSVLTGCIITGRFFLGCSQPAISMGGDPVSEPLLNGQNDVTVSCRANCHCDDTRFFPTCGADGVTYFSPCHAGCSQSRGMSFHDCSCINTTTMTSPPEATSSPEAEEAGAKMAEAKPGFCDPDCGMLYPYAAMNFFATFSATLMIMPSFIVSVRSISESDKPMGIGLSAFMTSLLGWFLGPVIFGRIVDSCCLLWSSGCDGGGSCSLYNLPSFRFRYHLAFLSSRVLGCLFHITALIIVYVKNVQFAPHHDHDVIHDTLPPEAENPMLAKSGNGSGKGGEVEGMGGGDEELWVIGGEKIYTKKNDDNVC